MKILVIEDERKIADLLCRALREEMHSVFAAHDAVAGSQTLQAGTFDLVILDVMLPGGSGLDLARKARAAGDKTPILMLTARDSVPDIVSGLDAGADDYLTKPFSLDELMARVRAVSRRGAIPQPAQLRLDDIVLDPATHQVTRAGKDLGLTRREYKLLELLLRNVGRVVERESIIGSVWDASESIESNTLDAFISLLRTKIDGGRKTSIIRTVRGVGYRLGKP